MRVRLTGLWLAVVVIAGSSVSARADVPPREIWPQATSAAREGDLEAAQARLGDLLNTGRAYGLTSYPTYALAAAAVASRATSEGNRDLAQWGDGAAAALDKENPAVEFLKAERDARQHNWSASVPSALRGLGRVLSDYRSSLVARADLLIVAALAVALTAIVFAATLFIRYGRAMAHDFREILGARLHGGSVSVLAFALLFLPVFLWLGPMWLVFYWFVIFFGYASVRERILIVVVALAVALLPIVAEMSASWAAGVESPVIVAALSSMEKSYQPEALRRMQELVALVPDNSMLHILLGNLHVFEGHEPQAAEHYRRAIAISDAAGAHVNLGNLHFLQGDYTAALTEYARAEQRDPRMAIAFYNSSVASGETYRFDQQGQKLEQAKRIDREMIERITQERPAQKIAMYYPRVAEAWEVSEAIARSGTARSLFGNYAWFDPVRSATSPVTIGALASLFLALLVWLKRRRAGFAGSCIKCGRTFCHRCKSARESATYCTQCIHIYLKRDGVALETKRAKLDEVSDHHAALQRRNRIFATFLPGSAQLLGGRSVSGILALLLFFFFVFTALLVGRLAPAIGPAAETTQLLVRAAAIGFAVLTWLVVSVPVYRRRAVG